MTNNASTEEYKNNTKGRDRADPWEKIVNFAGENKTILNKEIYKDPYDYSDNTTKAKTFISKRKEVLTQLPTIDSDSNFNNPLKNTLQQGLVTHEGHKSSIGEKNHPVINKEKWFKEKKENLALPKKEYGGMNCLQKSLSASNNRKNNLYNMKHLVNA